MIIYFKDYESKACNPDFSVFFLCLEAKKEPKKIQD